MESHYVEAGVYPATVKKISHYFNKYNRRIEKGEFVWLLEIEAAGLNFTIHAPVTNTDLINEMKDALGVSDMKEAVRGTECRADIQMHKNWQCKSQCSNSIRHLYPLLEFEYDESIFPQDIGGDDE